MKKVILVSMFALVFILFAAAMGCSIYYAAHGNWPAAIWFLLVAMSSNLKRSTGGER